MKEKKFGTPKKTSVEKEQKKNGNGKERNGMRFRRVGNKDWKDSKVQLLKFGNEMGRVWKMEWEKREQSEMV